MKTKEDKTQTAFKNGVTVGYVIGVIAGIIIWELVT